jgi:prepilin-type N-terminal cleavage/methylation domain-containing protein
MPYHPRRGLTLVEMLVAMTASLILFGAVVTVFQILGDAVSRSRRTGRLDSDMCSLRLQLQQDLAGVTANKDTNGLLCEVDSGSVTGYFEFIEGPNNDLIDYSVVPPYDRSTNASRVWCASGSELVPASSAVGEPSHAAIRINEANNEEGSRMRRGYRGRSASTGRAILSAPCQVCRLRSRHSTSVHLVLLGPR